MRKSRRSVQSNEYITPAVKFESQRLTSYSGLIILQAFFEKMGLASRLKEAIGAIRKGAAYSGTKLFQLLLVHLIMGGEWLSDLAWYRDDPLVKRVLRLKSLPAVSTLTRGLRDFTPEAYQGLVRLSKEMAFAALATLELARVTFDCDGSVQSTNSSNTEGTAVGLNKVKKGARSYYPLFITNSQLGLVMKWLHRAGNVHDSTGTFEFIRDFLIEVKQRLRNVLIEWRADSAHFSLDTVCLLLAFSVEFTLSVPFLAIPELKGIVEGRKRWRRLNREFSFFELKGWLPKSWRSSALKGIRFIVYRQKVKERTKGPIQLHLFEPDTYKYEYKVICTSKPGRAKSILLFHNGRGSQEGLFAELKSHLRGGYIPTRRKIGNQIFTTACVMAHNLMRLFQIETMPVKGRTTPKRTALWAFEKVDTIRKRIIRRAGRLTLPGGRLTLTVSGGSRVEKEYLSLLSTFASPN